MVGTIVAGSGAIEEFRLSLRPLAFGAAYKTLDMLVEHTLRANSAGVGRMTFEQKTTR